LEATITNQLEKIIKGNPTLNLIKPCRLNDGINKLNSTQSNHFTQLFDKKYSDKKVMFFIPASGSGSRMFSFLFDFIEKKGIASQDTIEFIEQFLNNIENFSFYNKLPKQYKDDLRKGSINIPSLVRFILLEEGLNFGQLPKGLIPFHLYDKFIINPFQEHILQGTKIAGEKAEFHFTINPNFEPQINQSIKILHEITGIDFSYSFSNQTEESHSIAFTENNEPAKNDEGETIVRPSGHGALVENLNQIEADIIFIKNIDNVQHFDKAQNALNTKKALGGLLIQFQNDISKLLEAIDSNEKDWTIKLDQIISSYQLFIPTEHVEDSNWIKNHFNRPLRICGMVKNEGQAGGGPFWVKDNDKITPQIIEKSQIHPNQLSIMLHATHFNPVDIVCGTKNYKNEKFDLTNFINDDLYFIVHKKEKGQAIKYIEKPGLWNGAMYNWLTLFYEIDSDCFSPVKTVLDLLKPLHLED